MNIFNTLLTQPLANGLILFYRLLGGNLGISIIAFSLFLRVVLSPLTRPYMNSMKKMKEYGPQLAKLKKRHGDDKQKYLKAQADFYREKGISPGTGCLPYILQIVVLIAFFNMFRRVLNGDMGLVAEFNKFLYDGLSFSSDATINTKFLYLDLVKPDKFVLPGLPFPLPGPILILGSAMQVVVAKLSQNQMAVGSAMAKTTKTQTDDMQATMQSSMVYTMPLITLVAFINMPSGISLYWITFSLYQAISQLLSSSGVGVSDMLKLLNLTGGDKNGRKKSNK